jgi:ankyrin repeat protein
VPLFYATQERHGEILELLIAKGANVNTRSDVHGATALQFAAYVEQETLTD